MPRTPGAIPRPALPPPPSRCRALWYQFLLVFRVGIRKTLDDNERARDLLAFTDVSRSIVPACVCVAEGHGNIYAELFFSGERDCASLVLVILFSRCSCIVVNCFTVGLLVGWLAGWLVGWLVSCSFVCLCVCLSGGGGGGGGGCSDLVLVFVLQGYIPLLLL